jgi:hypothetical protein
MGNSIQVKLQNHFKLYILFQDKIIFEHKLLENNIEYYEDFEKQPFSDTVRFFLLDKDEERIDLILKAEDIIGSIETLGITDFRQEKKYQYLYFKVALVVVILMLLLIIFDYFSK